MEVVGDFILTGGDIAGANNAAIDIGEAGSGNIDFYPDNDTDDYLYMDTTSHIPGLFWAGIGATDPGIYVSGTELGYRDETDSWVSFDSLDGGTGYWQLSGNVVNITTDTYDLAVGGTTTSESMFGIDEDTGNFYFGDVSESVNPTLLFEGAISTILLV